MMKNAQIQSPGVSGERLNIIDSIPLFSLGISANRNLLVLCPAFGQIEENLVKMRIISSPKSKKCEQQQY